MSPTTALIRSSLGACLGLVCMAGPATAQLTVINDFSNFAESDNMLNSASHNRELEHSTSGTTITIEDVDDVWTNGSNANISASQELFITNEFTNFTTDGYRLQVDLTNIVRKDTNDRIGLVVASGVPAGGPASGDVRSAGDYFYWAMQGNNVRAGMYTAGSIEEEGGLVFVDTDAYENGEFTGLYMERNGGAWDLGYIDGNGADVFVQSRSTINGQTITADGTYIGIYADGRRNDTFYELDNLSYGLIQTATPGDLDGDGDVDGVDLSQFYSNFTGPDNGPPANAAADLDGDGDVDGVDLSQAFGLFTGPQAPASVPEPTSLALLGLGGLALARRRR